MRRGDWAEVSNLAGKEYLNGRGVKRTARKRRELTRVVLPPGGKRPYDNKDVQFIRQLEGERYNKSGRDITWEEQVKFIRPVLFLNQPDENLTHFS